MERLRAELDEQIGPIGHKGSRRPRIRGHGMEVVGNNRSDAIVCAFCRRLVEAGHDPDLPLDVYRGETLALRVTKIGEAAKLTVREEPSGPYFVAALLPDKAFHADSSAGPVSDSGETN
jgi:hypothetical protein